MIHQAFTLLFLASGALSLDPTGRYCTCEKWKPPVPLDPTGVYCAKLDPTGVYTCNYGEQCKQVQGANYGMCVPNLDPTGKYCLQLDPTGKYSCSAGQKCQQMAGSQYGTCVTDLDPTGKYCTCEKWKPPVPLDPTGVYCADKDINNNGRRRKRQLDPTGKYSCSAGQKCKQVSGYTGQCVANLDPTGKYCNELDPTGIYSCSTGQKCVNNVCVDLDPTGVYCVEDEQCRKNEKCGASGLADYGFCIPELDPTGKYCQSTSDCDWYKLEKCENNECKKFYDRSYIAY